MFGNREVHRKLSGTGGYAAGRLAEISESLGQLAKVMKNSGEDPGPFQGGRDRGTGIGGVHGLRELRPLWHETGMPGGSGRGELFPLLFASLFREKWQLWNIRTCPGSSWTGAGRKRIICGN